VHTNTSSLANQQSDFIQTVTMVILTDGSGAVNLTQAACVTGRSDVLLLDKTKQPETHEHSRQITVTAINLKPACSCLK